MPPTYSHRVFVRLRELHAEHGSRGVALALAITPRVAARMLAFPKMVERSGVIAPAIELAWDGSDGHSFVQVTVLADGESHVHSSGDTRAQAAILDALAHLDADDVPPVPAPAEGAERDSFLRGYVHAMTWADLIADAELHEATGETGSDACRYGFEDMDDDARAVVERDCDRFLRANPADLRAYVAAVEGFDITGGNPWGQAGHDLWLTREGHGAGFWDRDLGDLGERLAAAARALGESMDRPRLTSEGTVTFS